MSKFVVTTFGNEAKAYEGTRAFRELHAQGDLTLYEMAVITKDAAGKVSVKEGPDPLAGTAIGTMVGALIGVLGGPAGVIVGISAGMLLGSVSDLLNVSASSPLIPKCLASLASFVEFLGSDWVPGSDHDNAAAVRTNVHIYN